MHAHLRLVLAVACLTLVAGALPACTSDDADTTSTTVTNPGTPTTTSVPAGIDTGSTIECDAKAPGELMTADEASIRFSKELVCPGYVTVVSGTPVSFTNVGGTPATVTVKDGPVPESAVVDSHTLGPGQNWTATVDAPGQYTWRTDVLDVFVGTIEVQPTPP